MWDNEGGKCSVVLLNDIFQNDKDEKMVVGKTYKVKYGLETYNGILKMIGMFYYIIPLLFLK